MNQGLASIGIPGPLWLESETWSKPALITMTLWSIGGGRMIIFIAGLNGVPKEMYESAYIDGAGWWSRFRYITIPQLSGVIFLLTIVEIITSFQVFTEAYIMTKGGPLQSTLFYNLELYFKAFSDYEMGLASALAWILFFFTLVVTFLFFKLVSKKVYYEAAKPE